MAALKPRQSAISWLVGLRSTVSPRQISTGTSAGRDVEAIEQRLDLRVAIEVEVGVRVAVAGEELPDAQGPRGVVGADQDGVAESRARSARPGGRMKARMRISPSSASVCTSASRCARVSSIASPARDAIDRVSERRPESMLTSPVNCPGPTIAIRPLAAPGRTISISPFRHDEERDHRSAGFAQHLAGFHAAPGPTLGETRDLRVVSLGNISPAGR